MGKVTYSPGIQYVKGSLAKPKKQDGHRHGDYLIGTHREAESTNPDCTRLYIRKATTYVRSTQPSANEMAARNRFSAVSAMVKARSTNLTTLSTDQAAFIAQRDTAGGKKTWRAYLWMVCGAEYDANH